MTNSTTSISNEPLTSGIGGRVSTWLASKRKRSSSFLLNQKNIYIFPSKAGFGFCLMLLVMLLTAINYQNSLIYLLTFTLGAIFKISIWLCFFNLRGLSVSALDGEDIFDGDHLKYGVSLSRESNASYGINIGIEGGEEVVNVSEVEPEAPVSLSLSDGIARRGYHKLGRLSLVSHYPFGLIRAWTWLGLDTFALVYPKPLDPGENAKHSGDEESLGREVRSTQLDLLRNYHQGDTASRVHWKKYAAADQLVVRTGELMSSRGRWLRWDDYSDAGIENALSYLCFMVLQHSENRTHFGLEIPGCTIETNVGPDHRRACLKALALYGQHEPKLAEAGLN